MTREEREKGHWIKHVRHYYLPYKYTVADYTCSECGCWTGDKHNYCPDCGADMRGEEE